ELIEPQKLPPLGRTKQDEPEDHRARRDADEIFPDLAVQTRERASHRRNSKPALASGPPGFGCPASHWMSIRSFQKTFRKSLFHRHLTSLAASGDSRSSKLA